jgi:hypothetical protein
LWVTEALKTTAAVALPNTRPIAVDVQVLLFARRRRSRRHSVRARAGASVVEPSRLAGLKDAARGSSGVRRAHAARRYS